MAESHKFKDLADLETVFPDVPWQASAAGETWIYNEKDGDYVSVEKGQFVVKIADRYEVHDEEPEKAKPAEPVEEEKSSKKAPRDNADTTVSPENLGSPAGTDEKTKK